MPLEQRSLPLFPLNTVLFPGAALPLQIFEERYKRLLQDCLDADRRFGIALIKSGSETGETAIPYAIGTVARITQVNEIRQGRYFVAVAGERRFEISRIIKRRPYLVAQAEILPETAGDVLPIAQSAAAIDALNEYLSLVMGLQGGWSSRVRASDDPAALSYYIAETLRVDLKEKQTLLEQPSAALRLASETEMLKRDLSALRQRVAAELRGKFSRQ